MELKLRVFTNGKMYGHIHALTLLYKRDILLEDNGEFIIMMFTGLVDKNVKDIYDCDIINHISYHGESGCRKCETFESGDEIHRIIWMGAGWGYNTGYDNYSLEHDDSKSIEVIGDIHTNPDLIK